MILIEKLKEFADYHGYYDGFYTQKVKNKTNLNTDLEWQLIEELLQDQRLVDKGLASDEFESKLNKRLMDNFEDLNTIQHFKIMANESW
nr:hypothetical protein [Pedobacter sp. ASV19]